MGISVHIVFFKRFLFNINTLRINKYIDAKTGTAEQVHMKNLSNHTYLTNTAKMFANWFIDCDI